MYVTPVPIGLPLSEPVLGPKELSTPARRLGSTAVLLGGTVYILFAVYWILKNPIVFVSLVALPVGWTIGPRAAVIAGGDPKSSDLLFYRVFVPVGLANLVAAVGWAALVILGYPFILGAYLACIVLSGAMGYLSRFTFGLRVYAKPQIGS